MLSYIVEGATMREESEAERSRWIQQRCEGATMHTFRIGQRVQYLGAVCEVFDDDGIRVVISDDGALIVVERETLTAVEDD